MIVIGIPIYNEKHSLIRLIGEIEETMEALNKKHKIIFLFVDDGSTDGTFELLSNKFNGLIISHKKNMGLGESIKSILIFAKSINATHVALFPGNGRVNPNVLIKLIECVKINPDSYIVGNRFITREKSITSFQEILLVIFNSFLLLFKLTEISDVTSCTRIFPLSPFKNFKFRHGYLVEQDLHIHAHKSSIPLIQIAIDIENPEDRKHSHLTLFGIMQIIYAWTEVFFKKVLIKLFIFKYVQQGV